MSDLDLRQLERELDRTKASVFMGKNAAFMGPLMCSMEFIWDESCQTAWTNGLKVGWNPHFFLGLKPEARKTVLVHELTHPAQLYWIRMGDREPRRWNQAADHRANNDLERDGYSFEGLEWACKDPKYASADWSIEAIYDDLDKRGIDPGQNGMEDCRPLSQAEKQAVVNNVVQAVTAAKHAGEPGAIPGGITEILDKFLAPVIPWEAVLYKFFNDMFETDYSWNVRDRRYSDIYMPGEEDTDGKLEHLMWFSDVSGSVTTAQETRFTSEMKHIKDRFNPIKMTIAQFDRRITKVQVITEDEPFERMEIHGRGGTHLECVARMIEQEKPTAVVIFSDLFCDPMRPLKIKVPIIWVCIDNRSAQVPYGDQLIHIKE